LSKGPSGDGSRRPSPRRREEANGKRISSSPKGACQHEHPSASRWWEGERGCPHLGRAAGPPSPRGPPGPPPSAGCSLHRSPPRCWPPAPAAAWLAPRGPRTPPESGATRSC
ncbi:unnamed protein product, partial [Ixodes pacificus]